MAKKVFIGVGHGGSDPGAVGNGFHEADLNLAIALKCRDELVRHGVDVKMSRATNENDPLVEEIKECNTFNPDLAIDIHNNAGGGDGAEAFYYSGGGLSKTLAENVLSEIEKIGQNSRGAKTRVQNGYDYYGFIRETKAPAVIVECAFVDNATDIKVIDTAAEQQTMGVAVAKGILKTLGIAYAAESVQSAPATTTTATPLVVDGINCTRNTNYLVMYFDRASTGTNKWGAEVAFDANGKAMADPVSGVGNMTIPSGGFVLSGHGTASKWILANIKKGTKVAMTANIK